MKRIFTIIIITLVSSICFAKSITLYDAPKADAKTVGTIDSDIGIIPIFTPKDDTRWIKVADPRNGNVGWIKNSDLSAPGTTTKFTFTQQIMNNGKEPGSYQVIQFGTPQQKMTPEQTQMIKQMQERQQSIQKNAQEMVNEMYKNIGNLPMIVPVIVVPESAVAPKTTKQ